MVGKLEFTQFDPLVAEKHSGLQGLKWEGNSTKRVENELNWIKSLTRNDVTSIDIHGSFCGSILQNRPGHPSEIETVYRCDS